MKGRFLAVLAAATLFLLGVIPAQAEGGGNGDHGNGGEGNSSYLALGDSVPFGFSPLKNPADADNFIGYPEIVAQQLDLKDVNATCPGEATGGFLSLKGTDNVCRPYRAAFPLHVDYSTAQIAFALKYLHSHRNQTRLVTLTLGANDVFRFQKDCAVGPTFGTCALGLGGVLGVMQSNLNTILSKIRSTGYQGLIVALTYYALDYSAGSVAGTAALNAPMIAAATAHHALIASGLDAWRATATAAPANGDSCVAGLLIRTSATGCDVHPTSLGRDLLAGAVVAAIAASCSEHNAEACLDRERD